MLQFRIPRPSASFKKTLWYQQYTSGVVPLSTYPVLVGGTTGLLSDCILGCLVGGIEVGCGVVGVATGLTERVWSACPSDFTILSTTSTVTPFSNSPIRATGRVDACCHVHSVSDFPTRQPIEWYHFEQLLKRLTNCRA